MKSARSAARRPKLFALGIIGGYLAGLHFRVLDCPACTIERTTDAG